MDLQREQYVRHFKKSLDQAGEGLTHFYKPKRIKFVSVGGQSKVFSFYSESLDRELVVKVYDGTKFYKQAE